MHNGKVPRATQIRIAQTGDGYFPPDSLARRVNGEAAVLLGGGYAVLLQLAHPFVSAGVDDHSYYQQDILGRLFRTVQFMHTLIFADRQTADRAIGHFHAMHERIKGTLGERAGNFPANKAYSGVDPETKLWVWATFIDTGLRVYELCVKRLTPRERAQFYADSLQLGRLLDVKEGLLPPTLPAFQDYMQTMLEGDTLAVTPTTRRLAHAVLYPKVGFWPAQSARFLRLVTAGMLPERYRQAFGLKWNWEHRLLFRAITRSMRTVRPFAPRWVWETPMHGGNLASKLIFEGRRWA